MFDAEGPTLLGRSTAELADTCCMLNTSLASRLMSGLNPTIHFTQGDVDRLPAVPVASATSIFQTLENAFTIHESHREPSVEFKLPGPSSWRHAQAWAQRAVDRAEGAPLPPYEPEPDAPDPIGYVSFAVGIALGRFGWNGEGILDVELDRLRTVGSSINGHRINGANNIEPENPASAPLPNASWDVGRPGLDLNFIPFPKPEGQSILPAGILFISAAPNVTDSHNHPAASSIEAAWSVYASAITSGKNTTLNDWLRKDFFAYHKGLYENRPIYFPLSSASKSFVAFISIHRWADNTLQTLLAAHLHPTREKLQGEINDLNSARLSADKAQKSIAEKQYAKSQKLLEELTDFIQAVTQCAEKGAPPTDAQCPAREVDAPFKMDLDDGVMINSAALWPLLLPQWKDPKKWWKELCTSGDSKDYDWAHLSARYFPKRVDDKCKLDPSLGVAHGCFWKYHPAKAYAWELRLQDELDPKFTIDEPGSDDARAAFLEQQPALAREIEAKEQARRERNRKKNATEQDEAEPPSSDPSEPFQLEN